MGATIPFSGGVAQDLRSEKAPISILITNCISENPLELIRRMWQFGPQHTLGTTPLQLFCKNSPRPERGKAGTGQRITFAVMS